MYVVPYVTFDGNAAEAIELYTAVFRADANVMRFGDMPESEGPQPAADYRDKIMHAELSVGGVPLMNISDPFEGSEAPRREGFAVHVEFDASDELDRCFGALAEGGRVLMPVERMFWGGIFGSVVDRLGVEWNLHYTIPS